jgi:hypothetical protein
MITSLFKWNFGVFVTTLFAIDLQLDNKFIPKMETEEASAIPIMTLQFHKT